MLPARYQHGLRAPALPGLVLAPRGDAGLDSLSGLGRQPRGYGKERLAWPGPPDSGVPTSLPSSCTCS